MKLSQFVNEIRRMSGDASGNDLSTSMMLEYIYEEMSYVATIFPRRISVEATTDNYAVTGGEIDNMVPRHVWAEGYELKKVFAFAMQDFMDRNAWPQPSWAEIAGTLYVTPKSLTVRVIGDFRPPLFTMDDLGKEMSSLVSVVDEGSIPTLNGPTMSLVRYRVIQRCCEELGAFDRAQYYLAISERRERELRRSYEPETTQSAGIIQGRDV